MTRGCVWVLFAILSLGTRARAGYWISYEADDFPENVGWTRVYGDENGPQQGGAERTLADGVLTLDGLRSDQIWDFYKIQRPIDPGPGEVFLAEWRVFVDPRSDARDVGVVIARDDPPGHVAFRFGPASLWIDSDAITIDLEPNVFHTFAFTSSNMQEYQLLIDGTVNYESTFDSYSILHSYVTFGDGVQGERSLSSWDYYRFGAVPEPAPLVTLLLALGGLRRFVRGHPQPERRTAFGP